MGTEFKKKNIELKVLLNSINKIKGSLKDIEEFIIMNYKKKKNGN